MSHRNLSQPSLADALVNGMQASPTSMARHFGYKAHLAGDEESGLIRQAEMSSADLHESQDKQWLLRRRMEVHSYKKCRGPLVRPIRSSYRRERGWQASQRAGGEEDVVMGDPFFPQSRKDFVEKKCQNGSSSNVFLRYFDNRPASTPAAPTMNFENLHVIEEYDNNARGSSDFQLFLTLHVADLGGGRYDLTVLRAEIDARIWINPNSSFEALPAFAPVYDDFVAQGGRGGKKAAIAAAERHVVGGGHWATRFTGLRAKTMRHELEHVSVAMKECDGLVHNFLGEARTRGKSPADGWSPRDRVENLLGMLLGDRGFPYFDVGGAAHKEIAIRDVFFMVGWYEQYQLGLAEKSNVAYDAVVAAITNYRLKEAMWQLGEAPPWLSGVAP